MHALHMRAVQVFQYFAFKNVEVSPPAVGKIEDREMCGVCLPFPFLLFEKTGKRKV